VGDEVNIDGVVGLRIPDIADVAIL